MLPRPPGRGVGRAVHRALLAVVAIAAGVACAATDVGLDRYRGAYATHFDGVPEAAEICAVITNRGAEPVGWVRLHLVATSDLGEEPAVFRSDWVFAGGLEPGERVALRFPYAPVADSIELRVRAAGSGTPPRRGRLLESVAGCSDPALAHGFREARAERTASGLEVHPMLRPPNSDPPTDDAIASGP